jgi:hypothetical protein
MQVDMAVEQPNTHVVGFEADDEIAICSDHCNIALRRNARKGAFDAIPRSRAFGNNLEDMALQRLANLTCIV